MTFFRMLLLVTLSSASLIDEADARGRSSSGGHHQVRAHMTKKGTYVPAHYATNRNNSRADNWSTKGNVNPYTGRPGTKKI
jgi:hypothetical protein